MQFFAVLGESRAVALHDIGIPVARILDGALLGLEIDMDDAKALLVSKCPLEVIKERPLVVTLYW